MDWTVDFCVLLALIISVTAGPLTYLWVEKLRAIRQERRNEQKQGY